MSPTTPPRTWRTPTRRADVFSSSPSVPSPLSGRIMARTPYVSPYISYKPAQAVSIHSPPDPDRRRVLVPTSDTFVTETPRSRSAPATIARQAPQAIVDTPTSPFSSTQRDNSEYSTQRDNSETSHSTFGPPGEWVILRSIQGERFWINRVLFDRYCGYLDLQPSHPKHKIRTSSPSTSIQVLLELLHTHRSRWIAHLSSTPLKEMIDLYELCQEIEADPIAFTVKAEIGKRADEDPWGVIGFASKLGDVDLGRRGIRSLRGKEGDRLIKGKWKTDDFPDIHPGWFIELLRLKEKHSVPVTHTLRSPSISTSPLTPSRLVASTASPRHGSSVYGSPVVVERYSPLKSALKRGVGARAEEKVDWLAVARDFDP